MRNKLLVLITGLLLLTPLLEARELSLSEAFNLAQQHSFELKKASAEREAYDQLVGAAKAERLPTVSVTGLMSYKDEIPSLEINMPGFTLSREIGSKNTYQTDVKLALPLYTGGRLSSGISQAKASAKIYNALTRMKQDEVAFYTRTTYLSLARAEQMVTIADASVKRTKLILDDVTTMYDAGTVDSTALLEAQLAYNSLELQLAKAQTARRQAEIDFLVLLGLNMSETLTLSDKTSAPSEILSDMVTVSDTKPELTAAQSKIDLSMASLKQSKADYFPTVALFGSYAYGKPNQDIFHDSFNHYFMVGLNLNWSFNLGGKTKRSTEFNKYRLMASHNAYDRTKEELNHRASLTTEQVKLALRQYQTAVQNYSLSKRNYELATIQHNHGALPTNRLLEIEQDLTKAESERIIARIDYYLTQSQLYYITGNEKLKERF